MKSVSDKRKDKFENLEALLETLEGMKSHYESRLRVLNRVRSTIIEDLDRESSPLCFLLDNEVDEGELKHYISLIYQQLLAEVRAEANDPSFRKDFAAFSQLKPTA